MPGRHLRSSRTLRDDLHQEIALPGDVGRIVSLVPSLTEAVAVTVPDRLVGATDWFIRGPFLIEGAVKGLLGGLLALILCAVVFLIFRSEQFGTSLGLHFFGVGQVFLLLIFGVLLGFTGSLVSVGRHLKQV